jgi:two-component system, OmpR family, response regulator
MELGMEMEGGQHLLVVDDDKELCALLETFLTRHGYRVSLAHHGNEMMLALQDQRIDLVVLDLMLPGIDGLSLCRQLRMKSSIPIIMLTAMSDDMDRIVGLEMGADDYVAKETNPRELLARIRAVLRRAGPATLRTSGDQQHVLAFAGWRLDVIHRQLNGADGSLVALRSGEFELLLALAQRPHRVLSRDQLLDLSRGRSANPFDRSVDVQISRIRRKIEPDPAQPTLIKTVRGGGYVLAAEVEIVTSK